MLTLPVILAAALVAGCSTYQPTEQAPTKHTRVIKVSTEPAGMRVYFGISGTEDRAARQREYVGESPCSLTVPCDDEGRFLNKVSTFARPQAVIEAEPPTGATNLFAQRQVFAVPALFIRPPTIPAGVFFDMRRAPRD